jgi:hypothetical protein
MSTGEQTTNSLDLVFELVLHHDDYIEFSVAYNLEYNRWAAEGMGWMRNGDPAYYLRSLKLNNFPAARHYESKAKLVEQESSLKFQNTVIEDIVLANVRLQFERPRKQFKR